MAEVTIRPSKNGPYIIEGAVDLFDTEGNKIIVDKPRIALCRCGASKNKPFCDGTHSVIGFRDTKTADPSKDVRRRYAGKRTTILDNRSNCAPPGLRPDERKPVFRKHDEP